jgi:hypothetical protein
MPESLAICRNRGPAGYCGKYLILLPQGETFDIQGFIRNNRVNGPFNLHVLLMEKMI